MFVDDNQMQKKEREPLRTDLVDLEDRPQPVQLVINQITKDRDPKATFPNPSTRKPNSAARVVPQPTAAPPALKQPQ